MAKKARKQLEISDVRFGFYAHARLSGIERRVQMARKRGSKGFSGELKQSGGAD